MKIKILLADNHKIVREGLRSLLEKQPYFDIVGEADNGRVAVQLSQKMKPDIIIIDVTMPELNGIDATRQIMAKTPDVKVIALSMHSDKSFVSGILRAGASGYLLKECAFEELTDAIQTVAKNEIYLSSGITGVIVKDYLHHLTTKSHPPSETLTPREREVLQLLTEGKTTKEIASHLFMSIKTAETHRRKIMEKLKIYSIAELTKFAIREGLTSLEI